LKSWGAALRLRSARNWAVAARRRGAVVDRDGLPADGEGVLVVLGREGMQGVAAVAVQVAAFG
jgi:hypothetical protein